MRRPVGINEEDFKKNWNTTAGYGYGAKTNYGYHDGVDLNLNSGGNADLGQPIYAIANGRLEYYHKGSHPTKTFGYHSVYKIEGPWGTRWVHNAHMLDDLTVGVQDVQEGQQIGRVGKSGTVWAHNHFSIFKVDPSTLRNGIDTIAKTKAELDSWWEDPMLFIERWKDATTEKMVTITQRELDEIRLARDQHYNDLQEEKKRVEQYVKDIRDAEERIGNLLKELEKENEDDKQTSDDLIACQKAQQPLKDAVLGVKKALGYDDTFLTAKLAEEVQKLRDSKVKYKDLPKGFINRVLFLIGRR